MYCPKCGNNTGTDRFCSKCGYHMWEPPVQQQVPGNFQKPPQNKNKGKYLPFLILALIIFWGGVGFILFNDNNGEEEPENLVEVVFDARQFLVEEDGNVRPMTSEEVIAKMGEPEKVEEWSYAFFTSEYPVTDFYYNNSNYSFCFYENQLARIRIWLPTRYTEKREIPELYNLDRGTVVADTPAAYRVEDCGVHDLWCMFGNTEGVIDYTYISYTNFFDNPYDPVMEGDGMQLPDLQVLDTDSTVDGYVRYATGHIVNNSSKTYSYVQVEINLYNGETLVGSTLDNVNNLSPGAIWEFKAPIFEDSANRFAVVNVTGW